MIGYGVDVSHHQDPEAVPWQRLQGKVDFVIVRAAYGNKLDQHAKEHVRRARDIGAKVGLYLFFRPGQRWEDEARALESVSDSCIIENGDIIPSLDIEDDPFSIPKEVSKVVGRRLPANHRALVGSSTATRWCTSPIVVGSYSGSPNGSFIAHCGSQTTAS